MKDENTYLVDHSTQMYAFDPQGPDPANDQARKRPGSVAAHLTALVRG